MRLPDYDYAQSGGFFVTICSFRHSHLFGQINEDGEMRPNHYGQIVCQEWERIALHRPLVELDAFILMPNHVHGIILITGEASLAPTTTHVRRGDTCVARPRRLMPNSLGAIVGSFKSAVSRKINHIRNTPGMTVWQRSFHDVVIRNEIMLNKLREYIATNPSRWGEDRYHAAQLRNT